MRVLEGNNRSKFRLIGEVRVCVLHAQRLQMSTGITVKPDGGGGGGGSYKEM